jgi:hypothetical protein
MKKLLFLLLAFSFVLSAQDFKRYKFKSGKIVYQSTGSMTGTETLYFDNYGMEEIKTTKVVMEMMGIKQETSTKVIMKDKWIYSIDNTTNTANKLENPIYSMFPDGVSGDEIGEKMMVKMGGKKIGSETIDGRDCDIWELKKMMSKIWVWQTIPIKTEINMMGMNITQTATSVETDIPVMPSMFQIPAGIQIQEMDNIDLNSLMGN